MILARLRINASAIKLFSYGFIVLFLELSLIRYLSGNVWNLGYFPNFVLIATFFGMGLGFTFHSFFSDKETNLLVCIATFILLLLLVTVTFNQVSVPGFSVNQSHFGNLLFFTQTEVNASSLYNILTFVLCFILVVAINFLISVKMAKLFAMFKPLHAYTLDILGSCVGILLFSLLSYFEFSAFYWFALLGVIFFALMLNKNLKIAVAVAIGFIVIVFVVQADNSLFQGKKLNHSQLVTIWSPYQKIQYYKPGRKINANNIPHQVIMPTDNIKKSYYSIPYLMRQKENLSPVSSTLILGAGTGNDVAAAILHGVKQVDAVEIDPVIADIGERYNRARPYQNPAVSLHINDGRQFLTQTNKRFDLIVFALTDSVVRAGSMSQLRLENYLFTCQSLKEAYNKLTPQGQIYLYNYYRQPWIAEKIESMLFKITGHYPKVIPLGHQFYVISIGKLPSTYNVMPNFDNRAIKIPTDNWPFLYLKHPSIPLVYLLPMLILGLIAAYLLFLHQKFSRTNHEENAWIKLAFLMMGVAFLLLETKGVIQFSLLFGNTWFNNAFVFFAVLVFILLANWIAYFVPSRMVFLAYLLLIVVSIGASFISTDALLVIQSSIERFVLASLLIFSPVFFANLVFGLAFKNRKAAEKVFGWNLLGAVFGGILEYSSMLFGYQVLTLVAAAVYILSFLALFYGFYRRA